MSTFKLGFLTHLHGEQPARELYPAIIDLFVAAEELGFDTGWVAQHHLSTDEGRLPSPLVFLSAVAARTTRIGLGTAIVTLSLEDPLRAAEDAAVLDAISSGRLQLGLGSGNPHREQFAAFRKNAADRRTLYADNVATLRSALRGEALPGGLTLEPASASLSERLWESPLSVERAQATAKAGAGILLGIGPAGSVQLELARNYLDHIGAAEPRIAVVHAAFAGNSKADVAAELWPHVQQSLEYYAEAGWVSPEPTAAELLGAMNVHHGTSDDILASLSAEPVLGLATDLVLAVQAKGTSVEHAIRTLEVLARDIAPQLGWSPALSSERNVHVPA